MIENRRDRHFVPKLCPILSIIKDIAGEHAPVGDRLAYRPDGCRIRFGPLKEAAVSAQGLRHGVACVGVKSRVREDDRAVREIRISDHNAAVQIRDRGSELAVLARRDLHGSLGALAGGHIDQDPVPNDVAVRLLLRACGSLHPFLFARGKAKDACPAPGR
jgi:hypothetical protein